MPVFSGGKYSYFVVFAVDISAFLCGVSLAWSSPMIAALESDNIDDIPLGRQITKEEESWIGSLTALGGVFGPPIFGFLFQAAGRKWANTLSVVPYLLAFLISAFAQTIWLFYLSRILMGLGLGGVYTVITVYAAEVSEHANRGFLCSSIATCIMTGMLFTYSVGPFVSIMAFNLILSAICIVYFPVFMFIGRESPLYLVSRDKDEQALRVIRYLRRKTSEDHQKEFEEIKEHLSELKPGTFADIFKTKASVKALVFSILLTGFPQLSGANVIIAYAQNIFDASGSSLGPEINSIIIGAVQFLASFGTPLCADRDGRKRLLLCVIPGAVIGEIVLGVYFFLQKNGNDVSSLGWLPVTSMVVFITFYNLGMGSLPWVIMSEILPSNVVSKSATVITSFYWLVGFILTKYFGDLYDGIGLSGILWMYAGFCIIFELFVYFFMFETTGKSLKDIQDILNK